MRETYGILPASCKGTLAMAVITDVKVHPKVPKCSSRYTDPSSEQSYKLRNDWYYRHALVASALHEFSVRPRPELPYGRHTLEPCAQRVRSNGSGTLRGSLLEPSNTRTVRPVITLSNVLDHGVRAYY